METMELQLAESIQGVGAKGDRVTLTLSPADVHDPTEIPELLQGYRPFAYRGEEVSPVILVDNDEDKYRSFSSDNVFRRVRVKGSTQGAVPEVDPKTSLENYKVIERYVGSFVPRQTQRQSGTNYNPLMQAGKRCMRAIELDREIDAFELISDAANWAAPNKFALGTPWTNPAADIIEDIDNLVTNSAQPVSALWMNQRVAFAMLRHPSIRDAMRQYYGDSVREGIAAAVARAGLGGAAADFMLPGLPPIKVVASKVLVEPEPADNPGPTPPAHLAYVMPDVVVGVTVPAGIPTDGEEIATTYTFRRRAESGVGISVREFTLENRGPEGGTMIVTSVADIPVMTADNAGGLMTGVLA